MSLETLFTRYGSRSKEAEIRLNAWLLRPDTLTPDKISYYDGVALQTIRRAQSLIEDLNAYRQALAARYNELETSAYHYQLKLERQPANSCHGVLFFLSLSKIYADGTTISELNEKYEGKQRHEALARFEALKKQRPGIEAIQDIEKRSWER